MAAGSLRPPGPRRGAAAASLWRIHLLALGRCGALATQPEAATAKAVGEYHWPHPRGRVGHYGLSPYVGPQNLSSTKPAWTWHHPTSRYHTILVGAPLLDEVANVYLGAVDGVRKFSPNGTLLWTYEVRSPIFATPSLMDGRVYGSTFNGRFFSVSMETGEEVWTAKISTLIAMDATAVVAHEGLLYACVDLHGSLKGNARVVALNAVNGSVIWEFWPDAPITNFMAIFAEDGTLVFQDREAVVYKLAPRTGELVWRAGRHDRGSSAAPAATAATASEANAAVASPSRLPDGAAPAPTPAADPPRGPTTGGGRKDEAPPSRPRLPRRTGPSCPDFPVGNGTVLVLQPANTTGARERVVRLWRRRSDRDGGMVVMWFHMSCFTPVAWARRRLQRPREAIATGAPAAVGLVLMFYSGCFLGCCGCCCCCRPFRRGAPARRLASMLPARTLLALFVLLLAWVAPLLRTSSGAGAAWAFGESTDSILEDGGIILGFDGDFGAVPFYGWHAVSERAWGENDDWRLVDEALACAFERLPGLDPAHIHAAGFSSGGVLAAKVGFARPQYIASVVPISGSLLPLHNEQWATPPPPSRAVRRHGFAAMIVVGGEVDLGHGLALFEGKGGKTVFSFRVSSQFTRDVLLGRGQLAFICDHGRGHTGMPRELTGYMHRFFKDHPFDAPSPYATQGLPGSFDGALCEETRGLGLPGGDWHYACCSASDADLDPTPLHVSRAHLQILKRSEGIPDSVVPYWAPERIGTQDFRDRMWAIYGRAEPVLEPTALGQRAGAAVHGIHDDDGCRAGGHRSTVGGLVAGHNGMVYAVATEEDKSGRFRELPGCLHAYNLSDGRLVWQRGLPFRARIRPTVARIRGRQGLSVVMPTGRDPYITWKMAVLGPMAYGAVGGLVLAQVLGCRRRCCSGGRCCSWRQTGRWITVGIALGFALGVVIVRCWDETNSEVWAFEAATGRLQWRFRAPPWDRMAALGDEEGFLTHVRMGRLRTDCMPNAWSSPTVDAGGTVYIGHMSGRLYAIRGDANGDGIIEGEAEVSSYEGPSGFPHAGPSLAPGILAAVSCDELLVFRG